MLDTAAQRRDKARHPLDHDPSKLRKRRVELGRSQAEVADAAGISAGHMSELEGGTRNPSPALFARLAEVLECRTVDLMPTESDAS
jgi:transcriptional regulator with XRE-family HTH domain